MGQPIIVAEWLYMAMPFSLACPLQSALHLHAMGLDASVGNVPFHTFLHRVKGGSIWIDP